MRHAPVSQFLLTLALLTVLSCASAVHAETVNCTAVTHTNFIINTSGVYCLKSSLGHTQGGSTKAITINANNVALDLNGFVLLGTASPTSLAIGIYARQRRNITIRNGTVQGFIRE